MKLKGKKAKKGKKEKSMKRIGYLKISIKSLSLYKTDKGKNNTTY